MKKILAIALAGVMTLSLVACGNTASSEQAAPTVTVEEQITSSSAETVQTEVTQAESTETAETQTTETETEQTVATENEVVEEPVAETGKVLVAYFSWSGNTQQLAEMIQSETGADMFEIVPETAYTEDYSTLLDVAQQEKSEGARPALASHVDNWSDYSTIFVGYPNWWSDAPMVILSFLEEYDCTGKTIVPFCTSGGGGFGGSLSSIQNSAAGATIADGFHVGGSSVGSAGDNVAAWIDGLDM